MLVHVVDLAAPNPERDFQIIRDELEARDPRLLEKTTIVVGNKLDLPGAQEHLKVFRAARRRDGLEVVAISAQDGEGIDRLLDGLAAMLPDAATLAQPGEPAGVVVHRIEGREDGFVVERDEDGTLRVRGTRLERLVSQTDFQNEESVARFQRELTRSGVERELERAGVAPGDSVRIGPHELEWGEGAA
jgi:GTP-binding protein